MGDASVVSATSENETHFSAYYESESVRGRKERFVELYPEKFKRPERPKSELR